MSPVPKKDLGEHATKETTTWDQIGWMTDMSDPMQAPEPSWGNVFVQCSSHGLPCWHWMDDTSLRSVREHGLDPWTSTGLLLWVGGMPWGQMPKVKACQACAVLFQERLQHLPPPRGMWCFGSSPHQDQGPTRFRVRCSRFFGRFPDMSFLTDVWGLTGAEKYQIEYCFIRFASGAFEFRYVS